MLTKKFVNSRKLHKGHFGNLNGEQALLLYDELPSPPLKNVLLSLKQLHH